MSDLHTFSVLPQSSVPCCEPYTGEQQCRDFLRIAAAIDYLQHHLTEQPELEPLAAYLQLSPSYCLKLFQRWAGVSPKRFLQTLTTAQAKPLLLDNHSLLDTSLALGLSSPSRLYDHFVAIEAVTPGDFKRMGANLLIRYGQGFTLFGEAFIAWTDRGICLLTFIEQTQAATKQSKASANGNDKDKDKDNDAFERLQGNWPNAQLVADNTAASRLLDRLFQPLQKRDSSLQMQRIPLLLRGTNFQVSVWRALLEIGSGSHTTYGALAAALGNPNASRAVGGAVGANPVAWLIPCHRVIQASGAIGGYRWGVNRKAAMLARESCHNPIQAGDAPFCGRK
ncbi:methylated-DNA--[protein]-cysteine S-methyltransferase [Oceanobacter antarcticus]|uniref:Methylated-DNA--[protein]-cysteine S-methyltransferase n=1 Tax=Oceanobacter antarcticus TaxID=3133425 RepID=A0ABW8NIE1_9GAMM